MNQRREAAVRNGHPRAHGDSAAPLPRAIAAAAASSLSAVGFLVQLAVWAVVVLVAMDNLGINVTALVAGLGIGGVAVALAVQNVLGDLFASLSIVIDKPFVEGDFIMIDDYMGTVENIGLKTTRVRGLDGEQIIFSNSDLLKARVRNAKRQYERRVVLSFGVFVETDDATGLARRIAPIRIGGRLAETVPDLSPAAA